MDNSWIKNVRDMRDWGSKHRAENPSHVVWVQPTRHEVQCFTCGEKP